MRLVEDVDLVAARDRRVGDSLAQVTDVVNRVVRRRVHLDHVQRGGVGDRHARFAHAARIRSRPAVAVQAGGERLGGARLAGAPRAHEQVGVMNLAAGDGIGEGAHHLLLADEVGERARAVAAIERGAGRHGLSSLVTGWVGSVSQNHGPCTLRRGRTQGAAAASKLRLGTPDAPGGDRLRLLPSGPDLVHSSPSRRDLTITTSKRGADPGPKAPREGIQPR